MSLMRCALLAVFSFFSISLFSQKITSKKYPSLFWEITGNGLKKPSYLFGTMHVSSKMVFHLSDSFYQALRNVDAVALELNPDIWQGQMVRLDKLQQNYRDFAQPPKNDYLTEKSFQIGNYENELKAALSSEPTVINSLLYRSYKAREDFEEDTFLDLYIFQTGKKLGKRATGVENYFETERLILEAYNDMGKEKRRRVVDTDGESMFDIEQKSQDAYRRGDLDLLDSLDRMMERSDAFREKFLYKRNEIQANSIDTILQKSSLFVGVGAAHLAGEKGVIELLKKKGYKLRPIFMADRDATQKEGIDKLKVPVKFSATTTADGLIKMETPGPLYKMSSDYATLDRLQYSDMSNGSYYLLTRVKTHSAFIGQSTERVMKKIDSLLYEYIPGKIIRKTPVTRDGYKGYDISNRTRRGDLQRYLLLATPFEVLIFKTGGKENYVEGPEATRFFNSIQIQNPSNGWTVFEPKHGGFKIEMPASPHEQLVSGNDAIDRWEYEAVDNKTGDAYLLFKKSLHNFNFIEEDTFDLALIEESFRLSPIIDKQLSREILTIKGLAAIDATFSLKDGGTLKSRFIKSGPHYYLLAAKSRNKVSDFSRYFSSFSFTPFRYKPVQNFTDTFLHYKVQTPVVPELEENLRAIVEKLSAEGGYSSSVKYNYWPKTKTALFRSDSTGEEIAISVQQYPKYFQVKDSSAFWSEEINDYLEKTDLKILRRDSFKIKNSIPAYRVILADTNSTRIIKRLFVLMDDRIYRLVSTSDSTEKESQFLNSFYSTLVPEKLASGKSIFTNKLDLFIRDLASEDSTIKADAEEAISNIYYGEKGISKLLQLIQKMQFGKKQYFENKAKFIAELGYIREPSSAKVIVAALKDIFEKTADTSTFQNEVFRALAKHRSKESYALLKELLLQDPPVFESTYEYGAFFRDLEDSLSLTRELFPEMLQLSTIDDYKNRINSLLVMLVDSGYLKGRDYESFFNKIYFDARIQLKKQLGKDEKTLERENNKDDDDVKVYDYNNYNNGGNSGLEDFAVLLMPFYDKKSVVQKFFDRLLVSKDPMVQLKTVSSMLRYKKEVPDSLLLKLASSDKTRAQLYSTMEKAGQLNKFPDAFKNQQVIARSVMVSDLNQDKIDSIAFISNQVVLFRNEKGNVYFYKYRIKKEDDWKIGISGLQPEDLNKISTDDRLARMTDKRLKEDEPIQQQLDEQLKRFIFSLRKSSRNFFEADSYSRYRGNE